MGEVKESKAVAIYHRIMRRENFETAAKDLFRLLAEAQKKEPGRKRVLYLDIDGHKNQAGGFDEDMFELQRHFIVEFLFPYFSEVHIPLGSFVIRRNREMTFRTSWIFSIPMRRKRTVWTGYIWKTTAIRSLFQKRMCMSSWGM